MIHPKHRRTEETEGNQARRRCYDIEELVKLALDCGLQLHRDVGPGLLESAYQAFLAAALVERGLIVEEQKAITVTYRGVTVKDAFRVDLLVEDSLILEIKSLERLAPVHSMQLLTYLRMTDLPVGLLMNFGADLFREGVKRILNNRSDYTAPSSFR